MEDHLRLGRELKSRHGLHEEGDSGMSSQSDHEEEEKGMYASKPLTVGEIVKLAVEQADRESKVETGEASTETSKVNPFYQSALQNLRREQRLAVKTAMQRAVAEKNKVPVENNDQQIPDDQTVPSLEKNESEETAVQEGERN